MTDKQYEQLEKLLSKLGRHLGHTYCIIPNYMNNGCYIGIYDVDGKIKEQATFIDIKSTVDKILTTPK